MLIDRLECVQCGESYVPAQIQYRCDECGESLDVKYDYEKIEENIEGVTFTDRPFTQFRYREFLPVVSRKHMISMEAGGTPIIRAGRIETDFDLRFKMESHNPTGSFKDRGTSVELGKALDYGKRSIVVASTGNMGSSIAAYSARAGVDARIYVPAGTTGPKRKQMESHGAELVEVDGGYSAAARKAWADWEERDRYLMGDYPYRGEGEKTVGFEIADQTDPDYVVLPIGNGTLMHAVWKAFVELRNVGLVSDVPVMVGVQAEGCNTVVRAYQEGEDRVEPVDRAETVAGAIACEDPLDGEPALHALQESDGAAVTVSDDEILRAKELLAEKEGLYAEEAGAVALAGVLKRRKMFGETDTVICGVTGHGLKT